MHWVAVREKRCSAKDRNAAHKRMLLVTRPQPEADILAERLRGMGFETLIQPMLHIHFLDDAAALTPRETLQAILTTSANGVRALARHRKHLGGDIPLLAIGKATAREAHSNGFAPVSVASGDANSLVELATQQCRRDAGELLHVCGRDISVDIVSLLQARDFSARRITLYEARATERLDVSVITAIRKGHIKGILFYSRRTAEIWNKLVCAAGLREHCINITAYCLASSAAEAAARLPFRDILTARNPDEAEIFALLEALAYKGLKG